ncbi:hypothetical protein ACU8KH_05796 [Lachancea thermotolerans]
MVVHYQTVNYRLKILPLDFHGLSMATPMHASSHTLVNACKPSPPHIYN